MQVKTEQTGTVSIVAVSGEVDAATAPQLRQEFDALLAKGVQNFVIDLGGVSFMDSSGLASLVHLFKRVRIGHGDVRLSSLQPQVRRIFELTRLDRAFDIYPDRASATAGMK